MEPSEVTDCIAGNEVFAELRSDDDAIAFLAERCARTAHAAGTAIIREGDEGDTMILVLSGTVRICKKTPSGEEYTVALLRGEDYPCLGEVALFDADRRSATAIADTDSQVLVLTRAAFEEFAAAFPAHAVTVYRRLGRMLSARLRGANDDIVTLFQALVHEIEAQSLGDQAPTSG